MGYEALFSPEEWDAIQSGDWSGVPEQDWGPHESGGGDIQHNVSVVWIDDGYELACERCDFSDHVCDVRDAAKLKRLHELSNEAGIVTISEDSRSRGHRKNRRPPSDTH